MSLQKSITILQTLFVASRPVSAVEAKRFKLTSDEVGGIFDSVLS